MKYIIMCGGNYHTETPKQLRLIKGEPIAYRTVRLLQKAGVEDIAISTNSDAFDWIGIPILKHKNNFGNGGHWLEGFYFVDEPVCYLFGDVVFSENAIRTIVNVQADTIQFFASAPPFHEKYIKKWAEPFGFKVITTDYFRDCVQRAIDLANLGKFRRDPIAWELWQIIQRTQLNRVRHDNYCVINDWTCDIDNEEDYRKFIIATWDEQI